MKQARKYHEKLKDEGECKYSESWLQKFRKRYGGKKVSADYEVAWNYIDEFGRNLNKFIKLMQQLRSGARITLTTADERAPAGFKNV